MDNDNLVAIIAGISGEAIIKALHKRNRKVVMIAGKKGESGETIADNVVICDFSKHKQILDELNKLKVSNIIMGTGHILAIELAGYLQKNGFKLSIDYEFSIIAKNKVRYKRKLQENGFLTPNYLVVDSFDELSINNVMENIGIPCVVKSPIDKLLPQKCNDKESLVIAIKEILKLDKEVMIEEFIEGIDCTVPCVSANENVRPVMLSYYSKSAECHLKGFEAVEKRTLSDKQELRVKDYCCDVVKKTGIIGLSRIDAMVKGEEIYILECNSIIVTGVHPNQIEYGTFFIQKEGKELAQILVDNALNIFKRKEFAK